MDFKKRKRSHRTDVDGDEEEEEGPKVRYETWKIRKFTVDCFLVQSKRGPSPPSPPGDSNDREVSMILGQQEPGHRSQTSQSSQYSQHSSLLTDLSLTPSPPSKAPLSISTPSNLSDPSLESEPRNESSTEQPSRPETQQPAVDNKHENQEQSAPVEEESTCRRISEAQEDDEQTDEGSPAKASSINNNTRSVQDVILTCISENITSTSYCSPSPVYSIPSPGSAFSIVISKRRDSES